MSILEGVGLEFKESMSGHLGVDETEPRKGAEIGKERKTLISFDVQIFIVDLSRFLNLSEHEAELAGTITFEPLGGTFTIRDGRFNLCLLWSLRPGYGRWSTRSNSQLRMTGRTFFMATRRSMTIEINST